MYTVLSIASFAKLWKTCTTHAKEKETVNAGESGFIAVRVDRGDCHDRLRALHRPVGQGIRAEAERCGGDRCRNRADSRHPSPAIALSLAHADRLEAASQLGTYAASRFI